MKQEGTDGNPQVSVKVAEGNFESLAPELLLPILIQLPDLESLDNLLQVSPAASRLFDLRGVEILETVLSSDTNTHEYTRTLIRIVALLRSAALPPYVHDLVSFKDLITHETTSYCYHPPRWEHSPLSLPPHTSTAALREVLAVNQNIKRLAVDCLQFYLDKFKSLRPSHLADTVFDYKSYYDDDHNYMGPWRLKPTEVPCPVQDDGVPSWIEQQRVLRAFWRIRLLHEFKNAFGTSYITWAESDISEIRSMTLERLYNAQMFIYSDEEDCSYHLKIQNKYGSTRPRVGDMETLLEYELIHSVEDFLQEGREAINESIYQQLKREWASSHLPASKDEWQYETVDDTHSSPMWRQYYDLAGGTPGLVGQHMADFRSPLQHVDFMPFRRLGFAIWSQARLQGYGFLGTPLPLIAKEGFVRMSEPASVYTAWRSILTADERAEVERKNQWWDNTMASPVSKPSGNVLQQMQASMSATALEEEDEEEEE